MTSLGISVYRKAGKGEVRREGKGAALQTHQQPQLSPQATRTLQDCSDWGEETSLFTRLPQSAVIRWQATSCVTLGEPVPFSRGLVEASPSVLKAKPNCTWQHPQVACTVLQGCLIRDSSLTSRRVQGVLVQLSTLSRPL